MDVITCFFHDFFLLISDTLTAEMNLCPTNDHRSLRVNLIAVKYYRAKDGKEECTTEKVGNNRRVGCRHSYCRR